MADEAKRVKAQRSKLCERLRANNFGYRKSHAEARLQQINIFMRIWRNRQTRWLRVASRYWIYSFRHHFSSWVEQFLMKSTSVKESDRVKITDSKKSGYGGIGRRAGFRCQSGQLGAGSTPVIRTILAPQFRYNRSWGALFCLNAYNTLFWGQSETVGSITESYMRLWTVEIGQKWVDRPQKSTITQAIVDFSEKSKII